MTTSVRPLVAIIGGSGLYQLDGLSHVSWERVDSPFGQPSDELMTGELDGQPIVFLPRHGRGHRLLPGDINYRANIDALKRLGVTDIISVSAVGSLREELAPGTMVLVDQFIDRTFARDKSFFGPGFVAHVSMAEPVCRRLRETLEEAGEALRLPMVQGGSYLVMEGPQFSTRAESELYRSWGCSVVGMTNMPEAKLAREAELCYATVAMVTDYDCWHPHHDAVSVADVVRVLHGNADKARALIRTVVPMLSGRMASCVAGCDHALEHAAMTHPSVRDAGMLQRLDAVAGRLLGSLDND